ncbi:hypothetical protein NHX12_002804 [Muraenolepis orangiensis]|uniref:CARD domain-containing protein n=1 Tax=Muraenolepis orangiensis TaxID=630683 RepID=A0A9Q0IDF1_9TELE|nr:hypothetical protein NHX12_002804 [Muraenolepis orangiensis]
MHVPPFGDQVAVAVEEALTGLLGGKMFGSGSKRWFVKRQKRQQQQYRSGRRPCNGKTKRRVAGILKQHRERILAELDVSSVLPYLVYDKVFSLAEYKEILGQASAEKRAEVFLECLSSKGPAAFCSFCSVLEEVRPQLLTCFLLDDDDGAPGPGRKGGLLDPLNKFRAPRSGGKSPGTPPTDPLLASRIHASPTAGSITASSSASTIHQGKPSLRRIKGRMHRSKSLDSIDLLDANVSSPCEARKMYRRDIKL